MVPCSSDYSDYTSSKTDAVKASNLNCIVIKISVIKSVNYWKKNLADNWSISSQQMIRKNEKGNMQSVRGEEKRFL